jgi:hypothetical protein
VSLDPHRQRILDGRIVGVVAHQVVRAKGEHAQTFVGIVSNPHGAGGRQARRPGLEYSETGALGDHGYIWSECLQILELAMKA